MIALLKTKIFNLINEKYGISFRKTGEKTILKKKLRLVEGTFREPPDYDDAWSLMLALHSKIVFDVGANIGQSAITFLLSKTIEKIVLIDPNPQALSIAAENLFMNNLSKDAIFMPAFASNRSNETVQFWTIGAGSAGSMFQSHAISARNADLTYTVPTVTLDSLSNYYNLVPDYVKIDVEGAESLVLEGAENIAHTQICKFLVEMHSNAELSMANNASKVLAWCQNNLYNAWYLKEHLLLEDVKQIQHRGRCHLLLLPKTYEFPAYLAAIDQGSPLPNVPQEIIRDF